MIPDISNLGTADIVLGAVLFLYLLRGATRSTAKSFIALVMLPFVFLSYYFVPVLLGKHLLIPRHLMGFFKLIIISLIIITVCKWIIYFGVGVVTGWKKDKERGFLSKLFSRIPGILFSLTEGALLLTFFMWTIDYFDMALSINYSKYVDPLYQNVWYQKVTPHNPIFDLPGTKPVKIAISTLSNKGRLEKLQMQESFQKIKKLPILRKIELDKDFQNQLKDMDYLKLIKHSMIYELLKDESFYKALTSKRLVNDCINLCPRALKEMIMEREGLLSGISLDFLKVNNLEENESSDQNESKFVPEVKIHLKNGYSFEAIILQRSPRKTLIKMREGTLTVNNSEIESIFPIKRK